MTDHNKNYVGKTAPLKWAIAATVLVSLVMLLFYEEVGSLFFFLSIISTTLSTFFVAWLGVRRLNRERNGSLDGASMGFVLGWLALIIPAIVLALFADPPAGAGSSNRVDDIFLYVFMGFFFGGFLGPICGTITGLVLAKRLHNNDKIVDQSF